jgi:hypothetical protein
VAHVVRVEAEAAVFTLRDVSVGVSEEELILFARDQGGTDVFDEAEDIGEVLPGLLAPVVVAVFGVQREPTSTFSTWIVSGRGEDFATSGDLVQAGEETDLRAEEARNSGDRAHGLREASLAGHHGVDLEVSVREG